jgi:hypothetical protein
MGWLVGAVLASLVASVIIVKVFDYLFAGLMGGLASTARTVLFVGTWTAVTVSSGMHGLTSQVRQLRQGNAKAIEAFTKVNGPKEMTK